MPTEVIHAIRTTAEWNANLVEMEALYGPNNYYTSLIGWESGQQRNLVTADEIAIAEVYRNDFTSIGAFSISGWTTSATQRIIVRAAPGHEQNGDVVQPSTIEGYTIIQEGHVDLIDLHFNSATRWQVLNMVYNNGSVRRCVVNAGRNGVRTRSDMINCVVALNDGNDVAIIARGSGVTIDNCTTFMGSSGYRIENDTLLRNSVAMWASGTEIAHTGGTLTMENVMTDTGASYPRTGVLPIDLAPSDFVNLNVPNLRPSSTSQLLNNASDTGLVLDNERKARP